MLFFPSILLSRHFALPPLLSRCSSLLMLCSPANLLCHQSRLLSLYFPVILLSSLSALELLCSPAALLSGGSTLPLFYSPVTALLPLLSCSYVLLQLLSYKSAILPICSSTNLHFHCSTLLTPCSPAALLSLYTSILLLNSTVSQLSHTFSLPPLIYNSVLLPLSQLVALICKRKKIDC